MMTKRTRYKRRQCAFFSGWLLRSVRQGEELGVESLPLRIERSQLRWFGHLIRMPPGRLPVGVFQARPTGTRDFFQTVAVYSPVSVHLTGKSARGFSAARTVVEDSWTH
ncbi:hypothetical protein SRHO_G00310830 [Serrasalmus rhombeus]